MDVATLRRRPVLLAVVSTTVALLAAIGAAAGVSAITKDDPAPREVDAEMPLDAPDKEPQAVVEGEPEGDPFPTTELAKLEGGLASLADYRGKPVLVNFFASYCGPCIREMPALQRVHDDLGDRVHFVGIDVKDAQKDAEAFVEQTGVRYDILRDPAGTLTLDVGVINLPATFLLSPDGHILAAHPGEASEAELRELITTRYP
jgi:thiol-disulfide isomerase/thioredoxin